MADLQRARILSAMVQVCARRGASSVTVADVVRRAGISRRTFYELFADCEDCLLAALDRVIELATARACGAYERGGPWREQVRSGLLELLAFVEEQPDASRLLIVGSLGAGERALRRRARLLARFVTAVERGASRYEGPDGHAKLVAEGVVGAVLSVLHARIVSGADSVLELLNPLMSMIVLPYLGPAAARRELERPPPSARSSASPSRTALESPGMRITYRTMRVLAAIAEQPEASNRGVADAAGMRDQGQISKLLRRLEGLELIENTASSARGVPNAWRLTARGVQLHEAVGMRAPAE